jgi:methyl-accepting chemotaxis protein
MVSQIQTDANNANDSMVQSSTEMENLAQKAAGVTAILNDIIDHVGNVNSQIGQIATAAQQQTTATAEISNNMQGVSNLTQESSRLSGETNDNIDKILEDGRNLVEMLKTFKLTR